MNAVRRRRRRLPVDLVLDRVRFRAVEVGAVLRNAPVVAAARGEHVVAALPLLDSVERLLPIAGSAIFYIFFLFLTKRPVHNTEVLRTLHYFYF